MESLTSAGERKVSGFVAGTGFATLDRIYTPTRERPIEALGGTCANVLISLAMLGHRVAPILTLGSDANGTFLLNEMRRAGCVTRFIFREPNEESPVTIEYLDTAVARHAFSSTCPETHRRLPSYRPLAQSNAHRARDAIQAASIFYVDRLSVTTLRAMEDASRNGAVVFFEPNAIRDFELFRRALAFIDIVKVSADTRSEMDGMDFKAPPYFITTHGGDGLTLQTSTDTLTLPSLIAPRLIDTCGAGDMVTTGLIHALMTAGSRRCSIRVDDVYAGLVMGQWLAALNCAFVGARGLFHAFTGAVLREALASSPEHVLSVAGIEPYAGYELSDRQL
jgi:fructokinase